jgi:hypothetical protein
MKTKSHLSMTMTPGGLLDGTTSPDPYKTAKYYSSDISDKSAKDTNEIIMYDRAKLDQEDVDTYLNSILVKAKLYMGDLTTVCDRDEIKKSIERILCDSGVFACVLGGKSTGKTLVINNIVQSEKKKM